jgi:glycosyltransferase involved in cell wall biosynthesis
MASERGCTISVVVPVYNSEGSLAELVRRLEAVLRENAARFEIILVNDGSRDNSWSTIQDLCAQHPFVRGISMMRNYGQHNALLCGIRAARQEVIVTIDDDLQNPPEEIPRLLDRLGEGFEVVYGRPQQEQHGLWRDFASVITKWTLQQTMGADTARSISAFRVFYTRLRNAFSDYRSPYVSIDVLLTWATAKFSAIKVKHDARTIGRSNYTLKKLITHAVNMMTGFSTWPLRLASLVGIGFTLFGMAILAFVVVRYVLAGDSVPGFPFLASMIAIFSGAQLFSLGIIGEYLARLHLRMMERPTYVVDRVAAHREGADRESADRESADRESADRESASHESADREMGEVAKQVET